MLKMKILPLFLVGGTGRFTPEDKEETAREFIRHIRAYVSGTLDPASVQSPKYSATVHPPALA
jgi:hypothetical protein